MLFPEEVKDQVFMRSGGKCECASLHEGNKVASHHGGGCPAAFTRYDGRWEASPKTVVESGAGATLSNCEALCLMCAYLAASVDK